jgi:signal transduction histidine kinase
MKKFQPKITGLRHGRWIFVVVRNRLRLILGRNAPDPDEPLVEIERLRSVFQQMPLVLLVTCINTGLTAIVLAPVADHHFLVLWTALIVVFSAIRWIGRQRYMAAALEAGRCRALAAVSIMGALTTGMLWSLCPIVLFPLPETYQLFFTVAVAGMCAGTTSVNSAHMPTVMAFVLPTCLSLGGRLLHENSSPWLVSGLMILVFAVALSISSARAHRRFGEHVRLRLALSRQGHALTEANERLRAEVQQRQKAEAILHQAQKIEAIGHLTGGIAHDFNNLLHVVGGNLSMIGRLADGDPRILGYVRAAEQAAKQGARLTSSLLAFARRQSLQVQRVDPNALLQEFHPLLLRVIDDRIELQVAPAPDLPTCMADPAHFKSAILNVVINARDAMPEGGRLFIATGVKMLGEEDLLANPDASPGRFVGVTVQDTGSGMTETVLERAFEPFFTTKEVGKGSGLGLSQVYGFARQSGGHVHLHSEPGQGTCVSLYLPVAGD